MEEVRLDSRPSKFPVKDDRDGLLRKIRSLLNRVSSLNYVECRRRWLHFLLPLGREELNEALGLLISKALADAIYMNIYAHLLGYLLHKLKSNRKAEVESLIVAKVHKELVKLRTDRDLAMFHNADDQISLEKAKTVSLHRFIAELYNCEVCTFGFVKTRINNLLFLGSNEERTRHDNTTGRDAELLAIEEDLECISVFLTFAGAKLFEVRRSWLEKTFEQLHLKANRTHRLSSRMKFMLEDLEDLKSSEWRPAHKWWAPAVNLYSYDDSEDDSELESYDDGPDVIAHGHRRRNASSRTYSSGDDDVTSNAEEIGAFHRDSSCSPKFDQGVAISQKGAVQPHPSLQNILRTLSRVNKVKEEAMIKKLEEDLTILWESDNLKKACELMVNKICNETGDAFVAVYASIISKVRGGYAAKFQSLCKDSLLNMLQKCPTNISALKFLRELYKINLVKSEDVKNFFDEIMTSDIILNDEETALSIINLLRDMGEKLEETSGTGSSKTGPSCMNDILPKLQKKTFHLKCGTQLCFGKLSEYLVKSKTG